MADKTEKSPESAALAAALADFLNDATIATDPMMPYRRFCERIEALNFPTPERAAEAAVKVAYFRDRCMPMLRRGDRRGFDGELQKLDDELLVLARPLPVISEFDRMKDIACRVYLWGTNELEAAIAMLKDGERLGRVTEEEIEIGGRKVSRKAIRLYLKPRFSNLTDDEWLNGFPRKKGVVPV